MEFLMLIFLRQLSQVFFELPAFGFRQLTHDKGLSALILLYLAVNLSLHKAHVTP
jgi:hypothetical protein